MTSNNWTKILEKKFNLSDASQQKTLLHDFDFLSHLNHLIRRSKGVSKVIETVSNT